MIRYMAVGAMVLAAAFAGQARAQAVVEEPGYCAQYYPNSNCQAWCENPDDSDKSKLKILAWRSHFVDPELMSESQAAVRELDPTKRIALYHKIQEQFMERAPFAMVLQRNAVAVLGHGVSGFKVGPMPDYTHYFTIRKV